MLPYIFLMAVLLCVGNMSCCEQGHIQNTSVAKIADLHFLPYLHKSKMTFLFLYKGICTEGWTSWLLTVTPQILLSLID
jgi:hypothetical protein